MNRQTRVAAAVVGLVLGLAGARPAVSAEPKSTVEQIRKELMQLPYYGVFDFLAFGYDKGTVTLMGYAYHPALKKDAVRAVKRVAGVDDVVDKIEELTVSPNDDDIRWAAYYKIYRRSVPVALRAWRRRALGPSAPVRRRLPPDGSGALSWHGADRRLPDSHRRQGRGSCCSVWWTTKPTRMSPV